MDEFNEFDLHVLLYSKSWYIEKNALQDVTLLISKISGCEIKYVSPIDVVMQVAGTMHKLIAKQYTNGDHRILYKEVWRDGLFNRKDSITLNDMIESHLSVIRYKTIELYPTLPEPNPEYLPVDAQKPERFKKKNK